MKFISWTNGKKTYVTLAVTVAIGVAEGLGYHVPHLVELGLEVLGVGFARQGASADAKAATLALLALLKDAADQVTVPDVGQPTAPTTPANEAAVTANLNKAEAAK